MLGSAVAEVCIHILSQRDGRRQNSCGVSGNHELWVRGEPGGLLAKFDRVLTFSHFLPRIDLLSEQAQLRFKGLPKMAGRSWPRTGSCGHWGEDARLWAQPYPLGRNHRGVRYLQHPLAYPQERRGQEHILA